MGEKRNPPSTKKTLVKTQRSSKIQRMRERVNRLGKVKKEILRNQKLQEIMSNLLALQK